jgi:hypothetical protein
VIALQKHYQLAERSCVPSELWRLSNNALQLTSGGSMRASRASSMRRLQLNAVLAGRVTEAAQKDANSGR